MNNVPLLFKWLVWKTNYTVLPIASQNDFAECYPEATEAEFSGYMSMENLELTEVL